MNIAAELEALRSRKAPLEMQPGEFRAIGHRLVDEIADRLATLPDRLVTPDESPASLRALSDADSVAVDPHKWLYAPLEAGCALVREAEKLRDAFSYHPAYYHFDDQVVNDFDYGPQNSRGFRALKVWLALRQVGRAGYLKMITALRRGFAV